MRDAECENGIMMMEEEEKEDRREGEREREEGRDLGRDDHLLLLSGNRLRGARPSPST